MKFLKTLLLTKSIIAAAVATGGLAAPAISHAISAGGPAAGVGCRLGYVGAVAGLAFKCSKTSTITVPLECNDPIFPKYVIRALGSLGSPEGLDICVKNNGVKISSTDDISLLVKGGDYQFAKVNPATVTAKTIAQDLAEAATFGGSASDVDTVAGEPFVVKNSGGDSKDSGKATLTHFTLAIPFGPVINTGPIVGVPALSSAPFVPQPLPAR